MERALTILYILCGNCCKTILFQRKSSEKTFSYRFWSIAILKFSQSRLVLIDVCWHCKLQTKLSWPILLGFQCWLVHHNNNCLWCFTATFTSMSTAAMFCHVCSRFTIVTMVSVVYYTYYTCTLPHILSSPCQSNSDITHTVHVPYWYIFTHLL